MADNDFTDFDEPVAFSVIGWKGVTLVPKYTIGDWEFAGEYSYIDFNTNWQACGGSDKDVDCVMYPRQEGTHSWGLGGDYRSPYAPYQDRMMQIFALKAMYTLDVGNGIDLMARYKYISDEDNRVTKCRAADGRVRRLPGRGGLDEPGLDPERRPRRLRRAATTARPTTTRTASAPATSSTPDLYAKLIYELQQGRADRRHDRRGAGRPRLRGEQRLRLGRVRHRRARRRTASASTSATSCRVSSSAARSTTCGARTIRRSTRTRRPARASWCPRRGSTRSRRRSATSRSSDVDYGQYRMKIFMKVSF